LRLLLQGEGKGEKMASRPPSHSPARPRFLLDMNLLQKLARLGYGYKRMAREYQRRTGEYVLPYSPSPGVSITS
jgi:hypothetical protein